MEKSKSVIDLLLGDIFFSQEQKDNINLKLKKEWMDFAEKVYDEITHPVESNSEKVTSDFSIQHNLQVNEVIERTKSLFRSMPHRFEGVWNGAVCSAKVKKEVLFDISEFLFDITVTNDKFHITLKLSCLQSLFAESTVRENLQKVFGEMLKSK